MAIEHIVLKSMHTSIQIMGVVHKITVHEQKKSECKRHLWIHTSPSWGLEQHCQGYVYIYKLMISNRGQEQMGQAGSVVLTNLDLRSYKNILVDYVVYHFLRYRAEKVVLDHID